MKLLDILGRVCVPRPQSYDEEKAEDDGHNAHVLKADAPLSRALEAPSVVGGADIRADRIKGHHETVEHCACRRKNRARHGVHDDVPAALCDTEHKAPERRSSETRRGRHESRHTAEPNHPHDKHPLASKTVCQIACRNVNKCLPKSKYRADRAELNGGQ